MAPPWLPDVMDHSAIPTRMKDDLQRQIDEVRIAQAQMRRQLDKLIQERTGNTPMSTGDVAREFGVGKRRIIKAIEGGHLPAGRRDCPGGWQYVIRYSDANRLFGIKGNS